jgi:hypothetical protein
MQRLIVKSGKDYERFHVASRESKLAHGEIETVRAILQTLVNVQAGAKFREEG